MKMRLIASVLALSAMTVWAAPPDRTGPAKWGQNDERRADRLEAREREVHLMYVVAISESLGLTEAEAIKMGERLKAFDERRRPLRESMGTAMKALRDAAEGDQAALAQVDANVNQVLDGRAQLAQLDKELFASLAQGQSPERRAKLALTLARLNHEMKGFKKGRAGHVEGGRHRHHGGRFQQQGAAPQP